MTLVNCSVPAPVLTRFCAPAIVPPKTVLLASPTVSVVMLVVLFLSKPPLAPLNDGMVWLKPLTSTTAPLVNCSAEEELKALATPARSVPPALTMVAPL